MQKSYPLKYCAYILLKVKNPSYALVGQPFSSNFYDALLKLFSFLAGLIKDCILQTNSCLVYLPGAQLINFERGGRGRFISNWKDEIIQA